MTDATVQQTIPIISYAEIVDDDAIEDRGIDRTLGAREVLSKVFGRRSDVPVSTLANNVKRFLSSMESVLKDVPGAIGGYHIYEMEIGVEVSAEGEVGLLGTGGKMGGKGSFTLKLQRSTAVQPTPKPTSP